MSATERSLSRRLVLVVAAVGSVSAVVLACSSFDSAAPSSQDEAGASNDGAADALVDTLVPPADAGASPAYCSVSDAAFCADFDDGGLEVNWTTFNRDAAAGATVTLDSVLASSRPSSMHVGVDTTASAATGCDYARANRKLSDLAPMSNASFSFDVWLGSADVAAAAPVANVAVGSLLTASGCNFIMSLGTVDCGLRTEQFTDAGTESAQTGFQLPVPLTPKWTHLELRLALSPPGPTVTYLVDGMSCGAPTVLPGQCAGDTTFTISPGLYCVKASVGGLVQANVDNVELRRNP
jgi:hypothetical protein